MEIDPTGSSVPFNAPFLRGSPLMNHTPSDFRINTDFLPVERLFDIWKWYSFFRTHLYIAFASSFLYVIGIYLLHKWMENRPAYNLRGPLIAWNFFLACFSFMVVFRALPTYINYFTEHGAAYAFCNAKMYDKNMLLWEVMFVFSKMFEFGDTVFIILRKRPVVFLHWYHHMLTNIFAWVNLNYDVALKGFLAVMNAFVHTVMYSYFTLRAMQVKVPKPLAMSITFIQIAQMFTALFATLFALSEKTFGPGCDITYPVGALNVGTFLSYIYLFVAFFYNSYLSKRPAKAKSH